MKSDISNNVIVGFFAYLWRRKQLILITALPVIVMSFVFSYFIVPPEYESKATILTYASGDPVGLSAVLGLKSRSIVPRGSSVSPDQMGYILHSDTLKGLLIDKFNLYSNYRIENKANRRQLAERKLGKDFGAKALVHGGIGFQETVGYTLQCFHTSADTSEMMTRYCISFLDSAMRSIRAAQAVRRAEFYGRQLELFQDQLEDLNSKFVTFKEENRVYTLPSQSSVSLKAYSMLKAQEMVGEVRLSLLRNEYGSTTPQIRSEIEKLEAIRQKMDNLELDTVAAVVPSLRHSAATSHQYAGFLRDIEVVEEVVRMLSVEQERAEIEAASTASAIVVSDPPEKPEYRARPNPPVLAGLLSASIIFLLIVALAYGFYFQELYKNDRRFHRAQE